MEQNVRFCPRCGSIDAKTAPSRIVTVIGGISPTYTCNACGFSGELFPEAPITEISSITDELNKRKEK